MALFTAENAAEMGRKSAESRKQRMEEMRLAVEVAVTNPDVDFGQRTLARVRVQLERLSNEIDKCIAGDSKRLKELTDAYSRLADQEQKLAMRPSPGSLKPSSKPARVTSHAEPTPIAPQPVASDSPAQPPVNDTEV